VFLCAKDPASAGAMVTTDCLTGMIAIEQLAQLEKGEQFPFCSFLSK
jgi:hypothetical protein